MSEDPNERGGSRRWIIPEVENSLRRLNTDYIDLYQVHRPSPDTDITETLGALTDLVRQGKVRYLGLSGRWRKNAPPSPASAARPGARFDMTSPANQRKLDIVEELAKLAEQTGITLIELAIAFAINHPGVTSAIVGSVASRPSTSASAGRISSRSPRSEPAGDLERRAARESSQAI